ncbi:MAG: sirohydrochlorin chelatase [Thiotrichales bacterium]
MKTLLLIAHGSRRASSNDEVRTLATKMAELPDNEFDAIIPAFLELAEPSIVEGFEQCVALGATEIVAVPYFLSAGRHVVEDIPADLTKAQARHPEINLTIKPHLGSADIMTRLVLEAAN